MMEVAVSAKLATTYFEKQFRHFIRHVAIVSTIAKVVRYTYPVLTTKQN